MRPKGLIILLLGINILAMGATAPSKKTKPKSKPKANTEIKKQKAKAAFQYPDPAVHCTTMLGQSDTTSQIRLRLGDTLCVQLDGTLSTGYVWEIISPDSIIICQFGNKEVLKPSNLPKGYTGYPEKTVWHFKAAREGKTTLAMVYHRPWEKDKPPAKTFNAEILVGGL